MKKLYLLLITLFFVQYFHLQTTEPPTSVSDPMDNIKKLYPAAPTANNLMKFEEVPVSNYTGIPDIKIPIAEIPVYNQGISMNVSLNYHPLNARPDDKASEVGLGWSLFAGGSITRTVRGTPDDQAVLSAPGAQLSIGILYDEFTSRFADKNYTRKYLDAQATGIGLDPNNVQFRKLFYEGLFMSRFDTEYDLYQYNFMGYTGRFIIKKDSNNQLFVEKLDKNNIRIAISSTSPTNSLEATAFIITDEVGNKYLFDILEKSIRSIISDKISFQGFVSTNFSDLGDINSAFHLSKISSASDVELVKLNYYPSEQIFYTDNSQISRTKKFSDDVLAQGGGFVRIVFDREIPAAQETNATSTNTSVRNLKEIEILGKGKINFTYLQGREDTNYTHPQQLQRLDKITIIDSSGKTIENYQFSYDYFWFRLLGRDMDDKQLSLSKITKYNATSNKDFDYIFNYTEKSTNYSLGKDHWGWFNCIRPIDNYLLAKEPSPSCMTINILKSIKLPSGGLRVFDFGSNTYSYVGSEPIDPYDNPDNWESTEKEVTYTKTEKNIKKYFFTLNSSKTVEIQNINSQLANHAWTLSFYRKVGNSYVMAGAVGPAADPDPNYPQYRSLDFEAGQYYAELSFLELNVDFSGTVNFTATYKDKKTSNIIPYLWGGGIRINSISYYDKPDQYATNQTLAKKMNFSYNDFTGSGKSSGALIFPRPLHHYEYNYDNIFLQYCGPSGYCKTNYHNVFTIFSSENFIPVQKTQGADVGYQNVKVYETGNGESLYTYKSPIDTPNPEQVSSTFPPFVPVANYDYKRGLLVYENKKDNNGVLQYKKSTQYNTYDTKKLTGISLRHIGSPYTEYIYASHFKTYEAYISGCLNTGGLNSFCGTNDPASMIAITPIVDVVGKANQINGENTEFFPNGGIFKTTQNIEYNGKDYVTKQTSTSPDGSITQTTYQYAHEKNNQKLINANMIAIPLETTVLKKQNAAESGKTISRTETKYDNAANLFPSSVVSYDLQNTASTEITYNQYDSKGNLQQYTTKDGIPTAIIWGYNSTQPIAKIVGATYDQVSSLAAAIVSASDLDASNPSNEAALITALDNFRKDSTMANYQISTYTYDPLIGVTTITPPSGIREVYLYDSANRLKEIRENSATGKLLKEFKYNYKN